MSSKSSNTSKAAARAAKAAELRAAQERAEKRRRLLMIGGVAALFLLIVGGAIVATVLNKEDVEAPAAGESEYGVTIGDPEAPHDVVVYEDFLCSHCARFEDASHQELADLAAEGKVFVEYRPFNLLGDNTLPNAFAVVLEESGAEVAKEFHDLLFASYEDHAEALPDADALVDLAVEAGADAEAVRPGIEDLARADWVEAATEEAADAGVSSTPTVVLDGEVVSDWSSEQDLADKVIEAVE